MHEQAEKWDSEYRQSVAHHTIKDGQFIPINRPCDWCGAPVEEGWIHEDCGAKERKMYLDILY